MAHLTALEAGTRIPRVFCGSSAPMGQFNANFVAHEISFMVFRYTFFCSLPTFELNKAISNFEFNVHDVTNFSKTTLEVLLTCMLRKTTNIDLVRLDSRK